MGNEDGGFEFADGPTVKIEPAFITVLRFISTHYRQHENELDSIRFLETGNEDYFDTEMCF